MHIPRSVRTRCLRWLLPVLLTLSGLAVAAEQTWKINLKGAEISELVAQVAAITGRTFVVDPRVKGKVTVISSASLDRDGVYELFQSVLRVHGYAAVPAGDVVKIVQQTLAKQGGNAVDPEARLAGEEMITHVIPATNVEATELVKILRPMVPQYGHIAAVDNPNVVIISDHADNIRRLISIVERIDVADDNAVVIVPLQDAWVGTIAALLEQIAPDQVGRGAKGPQAVQVVANERNNTLVLRGKPGPVAELRALIDDLDTPDTGDGSTRVIFLRHGDAAEVAEILRTLVQEGSRGNAQQEGGPVGTVSIQADESLNAIVAKADPSVLNEIEGIVQQLDVRRIQVLIEAAIVEVTMTDEQELGVEVAGVDARGSSVPLFRGPNAGLSSILQGLTGTATTDGTTTGGDVIGAIGAAQPGTLAVAKVDLDGISFGALLRAFATNTDSNLLSAPTILTLDNEEAEIVVGRTVPFRTGSFTTESSQVSNPFTTINREDVGLTLKVTPHIHDGEVVRLEVSQEVSDVVNTTVASSGFSDIVTSKRTINTTVLATDQQTIVLGGLIQNNVTTNISGVPGLMNIPLVGRLFRTESDTNNKTNLLVFLRPTVLRDNADVIEATRRKYTGIYEIGSGQAATPEALDAAVEDALEGRRSP